MVQFRNRIRSGKHPLAKLLQLVNNELPAVLKNKELEKFYQSKGISTDAKVRSIFRWMLQRQPTAQELQAALKHLKRSRDLKLGFQEIVWSVANTKEFLLGKK